MSILSSVESGNVHIGHGRGADALVRGLHW